MSYKLTATEQLISDEFATCIRARVRGGRKLNSLFDVRDLAASILRDMAPSRNRFRHGEPALTYARAFVAAAEACGVLSDTMARQGEYIQRAVCDIVRTVAASDASAISFLRGRQLAWQRERAALNAAR